MDVNKIKKAPYNPRSMSQENRTALRESIKNFGEISSITINERTGNIIAGNHRWEELCDEYGGQKNISLSHIKGELYIINALVKGKESFTGFTARVVDWDQAKEKAANVAANSELLTGEWTSGLQDVLNDISLELDNDLFEGIRLDDLQIDLMSLEDDFSSEEHDLAARIQEQEQDEAEAHSLKLEDKPKKEKEDAPEVKEIRSNFKIVCDADIKEELMADLKEYVEENYDNVEFI